MFVHSENPNNKSTDGQKTNWDLYLPFTKDHPNVKTPIRGSDNAAGYDVHAYLPNENMTIPARGKGMVPTGLHFAFDNKFYIRVAPRSGLAWKNGIDIGAGVLDADYRGEVKIILFNHSDEDFIINNGDRIAQLILTRIELPPLREVEKLDETDRGSGGFGSTGI